MISGLVIFIYIFKLGLMIWLLTPLFCQHVVSLSPNFNAFCIKKKHFLCLGDAAEPYVHDPTGEQVAEVTAVDSNGVEEAPAVVEAA
jgi:hypothetical protein